LEPGRSETCSLGRSDVLPPGNHTLKLDFKYDGLGAATLAPIFTDKLKRLAVKIDRPQLTSANI
jgi:hypothetical protein